MTKYLEYIIQKGLRQSESESRCNCNAYHHVVSKSEVQINDLSYYQLFYCLQ